MTRTIWLMRALLAALLAFASEILLWTTPNTRPPFDWLLLAFGYLAISALLLDLAARFRLRDIFGLMALAGVYGLLNALLLNPASAFIDFPRTFFTRAMGGHTLAGLLALGLWLQLTNGAWFRRMLMIMAVVALLIGVVWGYWAHYSPPVFNEGGETSFVTFAIVALIGGAIMLALTRTLSRNSETVVPEGFRLDRLGGGFVFVVCVTLLVAHILNGDLDSLRIILVALFAAFCAGIIWFQKRQKGASLLDNRTTAVNLTGFGILLAVAFAASIVGYALIPPSPDQIDPLAVIGSFLTAYGLVWLPVVTFILGAREFTRQSRAMRL